MSPCRAVLLVGALVASAGFAQDKAAPISEEIGKQIRERLPNYDHEAAEAAREAAGPEPDPDELVVLPEMTVLEKQQQRMAEEDLFKKGHFDKKLVEEELSALDRSLLNRYHIPFIGVSKEARAREIYLERKNREFKEGVKELSRAIEVTDPEEAKRLRAELNGWK